MKLITDVDGCLSAGRAKPFDIAAMDMLRGLIERHQITVIFASGRSQAYLECLSQMMGINTPYICENGAAIFDPKLNQYIYRADASMIEQAKALIQQKYQQYVVFEPNKEFTLSLRLQGNNLSSIEDEYKAIKQLLNNLTSVVVTHSNSSIDVLPKAHSKLSAFKQLCKHNNWLMSDFIGFGDSHNDLGFLTACNMAYAPKNCLSDVFNIADIVSENENIKGLIGILHRHLDNRLDK